MSIANLMRAERNYDNICVMACYGYKSKANSPKLKSRYRDIIVVIPAWEIIPYTRGYPILLNMWLGANKHFTEYYYRWLIIGIDEVKLISSSEHTTSTVCTYKVHDKYNVNKLMRAHVNERKAMFL